MNDASEEDLYWRLHGLSKMLEQSDIIDGMVHRDAYPTILDAMKAVREASSSAVFNNLFEQAKRISGERDALAGFALAMLERWPLGDVDGAELQEEAVKHGLLVPEKRTAVCSEEGCNCAEYYSTEEWAEGITCYRKAAWLKGMAT